MGGRSDGSAWMLASHKLTSDYPNLVRDITVGAASMLWQPRKEVPSLPSRNNPFYGYPAATVGREILS